MKTQNNNLLLEQIKEILEKLKTTSDCNWIFHILTAKTMVGTLSASFYEFQAAAQNPNINRKIFDLLFMETNMACKKYLLMNKGIPFEWRVEVLKEFEGF
ncbi:MAG: hypothetical protein EBS06_05515 [Proteobacteria bacterium]|nr:hypothetical protein [Pseudomonadota bacterium]